MSWITLLTAFLIEGVAAAGLLRGTAPPSAVAVAHLAAAALAMIALMNAIPGARGRAVAVVAFVPALTALPLGLLVAGLLMLLVPAEPSDVESTWDDGGADDETPEVAPGAASGRARATSLEAGPALDALRHGDVARRRDAARRLAEIDDPTTLAALRWAVFDHDVEVARHARGGLARAEARVNREIVGAREVLRREPLSPLVNAALGDHYAEYAELGVLDGTTRRHYLEMAVKAYARALELSREQIPELFLSIGAALSGLARWKVALTFLDRAVAAMPGDPRPLVRRTESLVRLGRLAEAVAGCRRALTLGALDPELRAIATFWSEDRTSAEARSTLGAAPPAAAGAPAATIAPSAAAPAPEDLVAGIPEEPRLDRLDDDLGRVFERLNSPLALERTDAYRSLLAYRTDAAIDVAWRLMPDALETAKVAVCRWLGQLGGGRAVRRLGILLSAPEDVVRREAAFQLERAEGPGKVEMLIRALESGSVYARTFAARAAAATGERRTVRALIDNLEDPRLEVRDAAINALARLRDKRAVPALSRQLEDNRPELRLAAVLALGDLADRRSIGTLVRACKDQNGAVRHAAVFALARTAGGGSIGVLVHALESDGDLTVRQEAARRIGERAAEESKRRGITRMLFGASRVERACAALVRASALDRSLMVRAAARTALDTIPPEAVFPSVAAAIEDPDPRVRHAAATKLGRLAPGIAAGRSAAAAAAATALVALGPLVRVLTKDPGAAVRAGAADALGRLGGALAAAEGGHAITALEGALRDEDGAVVGAAAAALGRILDGRELLALAKRLSAERARSPSDPGAPLAREAFLRLVQEVARREPLPDEVFAETLAALEEPSANVRWLAALALERTRRPEAAEPLLRMAAREEIPSIRAAAARGAAHIQDGDPAWLLDRIARAPADAERLGAPPRERDRAILLALSAVPVRKDQRAIATERLLLLAPVLRERATLPDCEPEYLACFRAAPAELARLVGSALWGGGAGDEGPLPARIRTASLAARVLGRLGREGVSIPDRAELREALGASEAELRHASALALGDLRDGESVAALVQLAGKDREPEVRDAARAAVARVLAPPDMDPDQGSLRGPPEIIAGPPAGGGAP